MKPPFKLNGTAKAVNFVAQQAEAARRFQEAYDEAVKLGFVFVQDSMIVPPVDEQTPEQKEFLRKVFGP